MRSHIPVVVLSTAPVALAADCLTDQTRKEGDPTGSQIANALTSQKQLDFVCGNNWRVNDDERMENTFNHGNLNYTVQRTNSSQDLRYCSDGFNNIIDQCIQNGNYWGGVWSLSGETYTISNSVYPNNPLLSTDDGGSAESSITDATTTTTTTTSSISATSTTSDSGPITLGPQTAVESGTFSTTTQSIEGLTSNSATTTTDENGKPTILPIWYVGPGVGIIVLPVAGVVGGGIVPPPGTYPPLTIDQSGVPQTVEGQDGDEATSTTTSTPTSTSTSSTCSLCTCAGFDILPTDAYAEAGNDGDPDLPTVDPTVWASFTSTIATTTVSQSTTSEEPVSTAEATQAASPINKPTCSKNEADTDTLLLLALRMPDASTIDMDTLMYRLRQTLCDGTCVAPEGVSDKYAAIYKNGGQCEISVGLTDSTEAYFYRNSEPSGDEWQECWNSTEYIIKNCIKNSPTEGRWNGDHVYQFYKGGVRPLNDDSAMHTGQANIGSWLWPPTEGLSCGTDCTGYIPNPTFCNTCSRRRKRGSLGTATLDEPRLRPRSTQVETSVGGCNIQYVLPDYPSSGVASQIPRVTKWYDRDDSANGNNNCQNPRMTLFSQSQGNHNYDTEHVYEKHFIKRFLHYLIGGGSVFDEDQNPSNQEPITDCATLQAVFGSTSQDPNSGFNGQTAAAQLGNAVSCYDASRSQSCPDNNRIDEFFLLRHEINGIKNRILTGYYTNRIFANANDNKLPSCNPNSKTFQQMQQQMIDASLAFRYMQEQAVYEAFNKTNDRMRTIISSLNDDPVLGTTKPQNLLGRVAQGSANTWLTAYDEFMARLLQDTEMKMQKWMSDCRSNYDSEIDAASSRNVNAATKLQLKQVIETYSSGDGAYSIDAMTLGPLYAGIRGDI